MLKVRIEGKPEEIEQAVQEIGDHLLIVKRSKPYRNRDGVNVRVYIDVEVKEDE